MKRFDRLMAIVMALQNRPETAQSLADKFEVSKRTIIRDMQALSEMGVPVYAVPGPSGGYRLMEGYHLPPLHLNSDEALVVLFALNAMTKITDSPFNRARWTALDKIRSILPDSILHQIEPILNHLEFDIPERKIAIPDLGTIIRAAADKGWIRVYYRSANRQRWLHLQPERVYMAHGFWYCEAYSLEHGEVRTFRTDRMSQIQPLNEPPVSHSQKSKERLSPEADGDEKVRLKVRLTYRGALLAEQNKYIGHHVIQMSEEEWMIDILFPVSEWSWAVKFFYSLGMDAEVLEPHRLRQDIYQIAKQVSKRYDVD